MAEKVLLVDDDLDTLRLVGLMLQRQGYQIRAASNGLQALEMVQKEPPDLILLDVMMPDMDGYEVARRLRADARTADIPIIMFTAKAQVDDKVTGFEAGADDYLTKPTQPRELFAHMKAVLARTGKARVPSAVSSERGQMIGILAARGGLGVTTLALNLGIVIHGEYNKDVIVAEFRPGQGTISLELGYANSEGFTRLLQRKSSEINGRDIESELISHASGIRLLLASAQPKDATYLSNTDCFEVIAQSLAHLANYTIIDLGTSLTPVTEKVIKHCDEIIVVVEPVPQTIAQSKLLMSDLTANGIGESRVKVVLVNRVRSGVQLSWSQVQEQLGRNIAIIFTPAPELAFQASMHNVPIVAQQPDSLTAQQFAKLAERIVQRGR